MRFGTPAKVLSFFACASGHFSTKGGPIGSVHLRRNGSLLTAPITRSASAAKKLLIDDGREFSELVDELVSRWDSDMQSSGSPGV